MLRCTTYVIRRDSSSPLRSYHRIKDDEHEKYWHLFPFPSPFLQYVLKRICTILAVVEFLNLAMLLEPVLSAAPLRSCPGRSPFISAGPVLMTRRRRLQVAKTGKSLTRDCNRCCIPSESVYESWRISEFLQAFVMHLFPHQRLEQRNDPCRKKQTGMRWRIKIFPNVNQRNTQRTISGYMNGKRLGGETSCSWNV